MLGGDLINIGFAWLREAPSQLNIGYASQSDALPRYVTVLRVIDCVGKGDYFSYAKMLMYTIHYRLRLPKLQNEIVTMLCNFKLWKIITLLP